MRIKKESYNVLIDYIEDKLKDKDWNNIIWQVNFYDGGGCGDSVKYYYGGEEFTFVTDAFEVGPLLDEVFDDYLERVRERDFNEIFVRITKDDFSVDYVMNEEEIKLILKTSLYF